jgi:outer membrane lipoprotein-sorting protein
MAIATSFSSCRRSSAGAALPALATLLIAAACTGSAPPAAVPAPAAAPAITDGEDVLRAMHSRYAGRWFSSVEIALNTTLYSLDGRQTHSSWREFLGVPGKQRIDYLPLQQQSGVLYVDGRVYSFVNGKQNAAQAGWNPLALLVADVYMQPVDTTIRQLDSLGFDLSTAREDYWGGDRVWVVGGSAGDSTTSQFWIDSDSLIVERVIQRSRQGSRTTVNDVRFANYSDAGGFPIAREMTVYRDGRLIVRQDYSDVKVNVALPPELFDPAKFSSPPSIP